MTKINLKEEEIIHENYMFSPYKIAKKIGTSHTAINNWWKRNNIPTKLQDRLMYYRTYDAEIKYNLERKKVSKKVSKRQQYFDDFLKEYTWIVAHRTLSKDRRKRLLRAVEGLYRS